MDLSIKPIEIKEVEPGVVALFRGDKPLACPFINRAVIPVPKNTGIMSGTSQAPQIAIDSVPCNSQCSMFDVYEAKIRVRGAKYTVRRGCCSTDLLFNQELQSV